MKNVLKLVLALMLAMALALPAHAAGNAENVSDDSLVTAHSGFASLTRLFDTYTVTPVNFEDGATLTLSCEQGIGSLYLIFDLEYGPFTVSAGDQTRTFGENGFLHEFADLETAFGYAPEEITLTFGSGAGALNELTVYTPGTVPESVQRWEQPKDGETDIVLFSAHGDDEQLFFAGLLPYYAAERDARVQVVYLTDHRNLTNVRCHEMLNGLWAVGVRSYPVFGSLPDLLTQSANQTRILFRERGISEEEVLAFVVEQLRRFHPLVAVGHDLQGEYGHGQHMFYADLLTRAVQISNDPMQFPESAETYGIWDVPKTYLHLYPENSIRMDWDQPLSAFGGMTAFQVSRDLGYPCHETQYWDFAWYLSYAESAASIRNYSPCDYGLYRSTVGPDVKKDDFLENLKTHAQRKAEEEAARLAAEEEARKAEEARLEAEQLAEEERLRREEAERKKEEERLRLQQAAAAEEQLRRKDLAMWGLAGVLAILLLLGSLVARLDRRK